MVSAQKTGSCLPVPFRASRLASSDPDRLSPCVRLDGGAFSSASPSMVPMTACDVDDVNHGAPLWLVLTALTSSVPRVSSSLPVLCPPFSLSPACFVARRSPSVGCPKGDGAREVRQRPTGGGPRESVNGRGSGPENRNNPGEFRQADSVVMATLNSRGIWEADTPEPHQFCYPRVYVRPPSEAPAVPLWRVRRAISVLFVIWPFRRRVPPAFAKGKRHTLEPHFVRRLRRFCLTPARSKLAPTSEGEYPGVSAWPDVEPPPGLGISSNYRVGHQW